MFPILFFSIATLTFYNKYGINPAADSSIFKTCVAFSVIYIVIYLGCSIYSTIKCKQNYLKYEYMSNYVCDVLNSIIIIQSIGSDKALGLIVITFINLLGSCWMKYR